MAFKFKLPELGEGMAEGEVASWLVKEGDQIKEDDSLVEIQNDKSVSELPSPVSGTIKKIVAQEGDTVEIGDVLVEIDDGSPDTADEPSTTTTAAQESTAPTTTTTAAPTAAAPTGSANQDYLAMPSVRQYARDQKVDLSQVTPTGKHGQITKADVEHFQGTNNAPKAADATQSKPAAAPAYQAEEPEKETREKMSMTRKAIAKAMLNSKIGRASCRERV